MNKKIKYMTIDEFMNTMKRRGTADLTNIQHDLLSPLCFKQKMIKLEEYYDKQRQIQQKVQQQKKSNQINYQHYYMHQGARHSRSKINVGSSNNISIISEKQIQVSNDAKQAQNQQTQQYRFPRSNFNSENNLNSQQDLMDQNQIQHEIVNQIHHLYGKQRLFSPPQQKRDLDNLQDYFKKSRNYQNMNQVIRQNSCECNNCGGRCHKIQSMKGIIPQFIPRQVIRNSLKIKWKKASKTLRKLCFFFKLAAGGHTRPKQVRVIRQKANTVVNNSTVQQAISIMSVQVNYNSQSNEQVRQILQNDPNFPPFLNLKGSHDQSIQLNNIGLENKQPSQLYEQENSPIKSPKMNNQEILSISQKSIQKQEQDTFKQRDSSSELSIDQNECLSPSEVRKALKNVNDNFIKELSQRRNIRDKSKKMTQTFQRNESRRKTQNFYQLLSSQLNKNKQGENQDQKKVNQMLQQPTYQTAYQKFFQKPCNRLLDVVNQKIELNSNNSSGNFSFQKQESVPQFQSQLKSSFSNLNSPSTKYSGLNLTVKNNQKIFPKSDYGQSRKNQDLAQIVDLMNQTQDSIKMVQENMEQMNYLNSQESQNGYLNAFNNTITKNFDDQLATQRSYFKDLKKNSHRNFQSQLLPYLSNKQSSRQTQYPTIVKSVSRYKPDSNMQKQISYSVHHQQNYQKENNSMRISQYKQDQEQSIQIISDLQRSTFSTKYQNKMIQNKIFNEKQVKQIQKDINHLRVRSLNICLNQQQDQFYQLQFQSSTQSPKIQQILTPINFKRNQKIQTVLPQLDLNQNNIPTKDEERLSYGILKRLNQKKPTVNIKFEI
ncbi:hypothetical protein TTHERM_00316650 (macronuclear) [Tetrahymena thermophila SB210]|uniref:Uncharacterized protein n=1 Tax=Tetrahymena thermophila (strain SB210) TaxID=312017 RepID=I7M986_TETTS|nr:hypothetical protein TTHERM_00316650 [Tetrahymena thermophila SB210]EAS01112.2 hypothetical protein TTHERM_00316650 [Tetrahymena thermophila SB210]|eukprot:XP_001021357.2 hypothetical protein TTHERM_00316650 [Tetrahymena thermophila SB210]